MATLALRGGWKLKLVVVAALLLGLLLRDEPYAGVPLTAVLGLVALKRWGESAANVMKASRLSGKWTGLVLAVFGLTPLAAGHGVAPLGLVLGLGWQAFPVPIVLGWLGVASLGVSPWVGPALARSLAWVGVCLLTATMVLAQTQADDALLATLVSLPFLACLVVYMVHLARIRTPASATA